MGCSKLNQHLYNNFVKDSTSCACGFYSEDPKHFLLHCPNFIAQRVNLMSLVNPLCEPSANTFLYGNDALDYQENKIIFDAVHAFITDTGRFN